MNKEAQLQERIDVLEKALRIATDSMTEVEKSTCQLLLEKQVDDLDVYNCVYTINQQMHKALTPIRIYVK
tara:strand:+ start:315 stop:524 length:210 start_codon:yes stop_codon:yes gene_type:complete